MNDQRGKLVETPFAYRITKDGTVFISWNGKTVTTLRGRAADAFRAKLSGLDEQRQQLVMAKTTGHFKHGTEQSKMNHPGQD